MTKKRERNGMTLAEVLVALVVLALGLVYALSALPVSLGAASNAMLSAEASAIALNYFTLLRSLPNDCSEADVQTRFTEVVGYEPASEDEAPKLVAVESSLVFSSPQSTDGEFRDITVGKGEHYVRIQYSDSVGGVSSRAYNICIRRVGSEWICFPLLRTGTR